jgi:hypothetical protein
MKSKFSIAKSLVIAAALVTGISGIARADDSSMNPLMGDSYADFNGGNLPQGGRPVFDKAPSAWRLSNPNGLSEIQVQALQSSRLTYKPAPVFDMAPSTWRLNHLSGLSQAEMQASSSWGQAWHQPNQPATSMLASPDANTNVPDASHETFRARIARLFHATPADQITTAP